MTEEHMTMLAIFEDLYRANMRGSVFELEGCMQSIELLPKPRGNNEIMSQKTLRHNMSQSITVLQQRLVELRTRFEALPELKTKKSEADAVS
jgi:hypothetical protein